MTTTISDTTKNKYIISVFIRHESSGTTETRFLFNGLTTSIYDYKHSRFFGTTSQAGSTANATTHAVLDDGARVVDNLEYQEITLVKGPGGWLGTSHGARPAASGPLFPISAFFIDSTNALTSVVIQNELSNNYEVDSYVKVWAVDDS